MEIHVSVKPETLFSIGPLDVTNSFVTMIIVMAFLIILAGMLYFVKKRVWKGVPEHA